MKYGIWLTEKLRATGEDFNRWAYQALAILLIHPDAVASLKVKLPGDQSYHRGVDLREIPGDKNSPIKYKAFISWQHEKECWLVKIEGADENFIESHAFDVRVN